MWNGVETPASQAVPDSGKVVRVTKTDGQESAFHAYLNPKRKVGSQSEVPGLTKASDGLDVSGYQNFHISSAGAVSGKGINEKVLRVLSFAETSIGPLGAKSYLDIGCSAGLLPLAMKKIGFRQVTGIDHDPEYIDLLRQITETLNIDVTAQSGPWNQITDRRFDVVSILAVIHWIYSMTDRNGSFWRIFEYLRTVCNDLLLIEFVAPNDPAVLHLKHLTANSDLHIEEYNLENFLYAAQAVFGRHIGCISSNATRTIYIFKKEPRFGGYSSFVEINQHVVIKRFRPEIIKRNTRLRDREVNALKKLSGSDFFPSLFFSNDREIHMSNCGTKISRLSELSSPQADAEKILALMESQGLRHNDINRNNIRAHNGRLRLIDFGWATLDGTVPADMPGNAGIDDGVRSAGEPIDDRAMLHAALSRLA